MSNLRKPQSIHSTRRRSILPPDRGSIFYLMFLFVILFLFWNLFLKGMITGLTTIILYASTAIAWLIFRKNLLPVISRYFGFLELKTQPAVSSSSFSNIKVETVKYTSDSESTTSSDQSQSYEQLKPKTEAEEEEDLEYYRISHQSHYKRHQELEDKNVSMFHIVVVVILFLFLIGVLALGIIQSIRSGEIINILGISPFVLVIVSWIIIILYKPNPLKIQARIAKLRATPVKGVVINYNILPAKKNMENNKVYKYFIGIDGEQKQRLFYSTNDLHYGRVYLFKRSIFFPNRCVLVEPKTDEKKK
jgi:hypothetical protein